MKNILLKSIPLALGLLFSSYSVAHLDKQRPILSKKPTLMKTPKNLGTGLKLPKKVLQPQMKTQTSIALGGVNGGGGNVIRSTPEEVFQYLETISYFDRTGAPNRNGFFIDMEKLVTEFEFVQKGFQVLPVPARIKSIISKLDLSRWDALRGSSPYDWDKYIVHPGKPAVKIPLSKFRLSIQKEAACLHDGEERDASYDRAKDEICLSIARLTAFPADLLPKTVVPLIFHEMAHEAGYEESDAMLIQQYVASQMISLNCQIQVTQTSPIGPGARLRVTFKNSSSARFSMEDWTVRDAIDGFYGYISNNWEVLRGIYKEDVRFSDGRVQKRGELSSDGFQIHWNSDSSGEMQFSALDVDSKGKPNVVKNKLRWSRPVRFSGNSAVHGGYGANGLPGTKLTIKSLDYTAENSEISLEFSGSCF